MRIIAFILALCVLTCSTVPCCAGDNCAGKYSAGQSSKEKGKDCMGNCSPFFACGTCAGSSVNVHSITISPALVAGKIVYTDFYICSHSDYFHSYWQPPKED